MTSYVVSTNRTPHILEFVTYSQFVEISEQFPRN